MNSIEILVREGSVHPFKATKEEIAKLMDIAERDLADAQRAKDSSLDWRFAIAYNAVLQACRAYMFHMGYRPASAGAHKATFQFMQITVDDSMKQMIDYFDRARNKRHRVIYEEPGLVTEKETKQLIKKAQLFLEYVGSKLKTQKS